MEIDALLAMLQLDTILEGNGTFDQLEDKSQG